MSNDFDFSDLDSYMDQPTSEYSDYASYLNRPQAEPKNDSWEATKGFKAGLDQLQGLGGGMVALLGDAFGSESMQEWGLDTYQKNMEEAAAHGGVTSFSEAEGFDEHVDWALYQVGNSIPMFASMMATGGVGALAAKKVAQKGIQKYIEKQVAKGATAKAAAEMAAKRIAGAASAGGAAGTYLSSNVMSSGEIYGELSQMPEPEGSSRWQTALAHGSASAALDALPVMAVLKRLGIGDVAGKQIKDSFLKSTAKIALAEGATEGMQGLIEEHAKNWLETNKSLFAPSQWNKLQDPLLWTRVGDEAAAGVIGGVTINTATYPLDKRPTADKMKDRREAVAAAGGDALDQANAASEELAKGAAVDDALNQLNERGGEGRFTDSTAVDFEVPEMPNVEPRQNYQENGSEIDFEPVNRADALSMATDGYKYDGGIDFDTTSRTDQLASGVERRIAGQEFKDRSLLSQGLLPSPETTQAPAGYLGDDANKPFKENTNQFGQSPMQPLMSPRMDSDPVARQEEMRLRSEEEMRKFTKRKREAVLPPNLKDQRLLNPAYKQEIIDAVATAEQELKRPQGFREKVDSSVDDLLTAIAKNGGINSKDLTDDAFDWQDLKQHQTGVKRAFHSNGRSLDDMAEVLVEDGYMQERDPHALAEMIDDSLRGTPHYSSNVDYAKIEASPALKVGREMGMTTKQIRNALSKMLNGEKLGGRQLEFAKGVMDQIDAQRSEQIPDLMKQREKLNEARRFKQQVIEAIRESGDSFKNARTNIPLDAYAEIEDAEFEAYDDVSPADIAEATAEVYAEENGLTKAQIDQLSLTYPETESYVSAIYREVANAKTKPRTESESQGDSQRLDSEAQSREVESQDDSDGGNLQEGDGEREQGLIESATNSEELLTSYTEEEIAERERVAAEVKREEAERYLRAELDAQRGEFTLTGSDRTADVAAAAGQEALFDSLPPPDKNKEHSLLKYEPEIVSASGKPWIKKSSAELFQKQHGLERSHYIVGDKRSYKLVRHEDAPKEATFALEFYNEENKEWGGSVPKIGLKITNSSDADLSSLKSYASDAGGRVVTKPQKRVEGGTALDDGGIVFNNHKQANRFLESIKSTQRVEDDGYSDPKITAPKPKRGQSSVDLSSAKDSTPKDNGTSSDQSERKRKYSETVPRGWEEQPKFKQNGVVDGDNAMFFVKGGKEYVRNDWGEFQGVERFKQQNPDVKPFEVYVDTASGLSVIATGNRQGNTETYEFPDGGIESRADDEVNRPNNDEKVAAKKPTSEVEQATEENANAVQQGLDGIESSEPEWVGAQLEDEGLTDSGKPFKTENAARLMAKKRGIKQFRIVEGAYEDDDYNLHKGFGIHKLNESEGYIDSVSHKGSVRPTAMVNWGGEDGTAMLRLLGKDPSGKELWADTDTSQVYPDVQKGNANFSEIKGAKALAEQDRLRVEQSEPMREFKRGETDNNARSTFAKLDGRPVYKETKATSTSNTKAAPKQEQAKPAAKATNKPTSTAPEHANVGMDDRSLEEVVNSYEDLLEFNNITNHIFDAPKKDEIVRLQDKVKVYNEKYGWMTPAEARQKIEEWKDHAAAQYDNIDTRRINQEKVVLSLFDLTGKWSQPWVDAGYQVYRFDIQDDAEVGDVNNFSVQFFGDWFGDFDGADIHAILAACPCTDFASSGSKHFAAKDEDGRTVESVKIVQQTLATIEYFKPAVWAIENPVGRIERLGGLPPWRLSFDPNHLGEDYTKKTLIWGRFNADLEIAPAEPTEGSKMHRKYGGKSQKTKNARSATPEGFAYSFFKANNFVDHTAMSIHNQYDRLDKSIIEEAVSLGIDKSRIDDVVGDPYYMDMDDDAANAAIQELIDEAKQGDTDNAVDDFDDMPVTEIDDMAALDDWAAELEEEAGEAEGGMPVSDEDRLKNIVNDMFGNEVKESKAIYAANTTGLDATIDNMQIGQKERGAFLRYLKDRDDKDRILKNLEAHADTPWAKQAIFGALSRQAIRDLIAGKEVDYDSPIMRSQGKGIRDAIAKFGEEGVWKYLTAKDFIGHPEKPTNAINGSFIDCDPSRDCAKYCYATKGNYNYASSINKSELVTHAIETDPVRAAKMAALEYRASLEFEAKKALRLFDKGDGNDAWIPFIEELNRQKIRTQIFTKNPEFAKKVSDFNLVMLSLDDSNLEMAAQHPELKVALVYDGSEKLQNWALNNAERISVVLPVKQGAKTLDDVLISPLKQNRTLKRKLCPIDSGSVKVGDFSCINCDNGAGVGCFHGSVTKNVLSSAQARVLPVDGIETIKGEIDEITRLLPREQRDELFRELAKVLSKARQGIDFRAEEEGETKVLYSDASKGKGAERTGGVSEREDSNVSSRLRPTLNSSDLFELAHTSGTLSGEQQAKAIRDTFAVATKNRLTQTISIGVDRVTTPEEAAHIFAPYRKHAQEAFVALVTDSEGKPLEVIRHSKGQKDAATVDPIAAIGAAMKVEGGSKIWIAHNHPSGSLNPSGADITITDKIKDLLYGSSLEYQGHIILGSNGKAVSLDKSSANKSQIINIKPARRNKDIAVTERMLTTRGKLNEAIANPAQAQEIIANIESENALVLLNVQNEAVAVLPIDDPDALATMRGTESQTRFYKAVETSNAAAVIIKSKKPMSRSSGVQNLAAMMHSLDMRVLDVFYDDGGGTYVSAEERGQVSYGTTFFSLDANKDPVSPDSLSISREDAEEVISSITADWASGDRDVVLVDGVDALPPEIKAEAEKTGDTSKVKGVFHEGKLYVVRGNLENREQLEHTIFHEAYGHYGLRKAFGKELEAKLNEIYFAIGGRSGIKKYGEKHGFDTKSFEKYDNYLKSAGYDDHIQRAIMTEEMLAHMAQNHGKPSVKRKIMEFLGQLRAWLREHGFAKLSKMNDADLFYVLRRSRNAMKNLDSKSGKSQTRFMVAYHGTPHSFDEFSLDAMGTGEGAQAYGWGMYFAGKREVAEFYRDSLTRNDMHAVRMKDGSSLEDNKLSEIIRKQGGVDNAVKYLDAKASKSPLAAIRAEAKRQASWLRNNLENIVFKPKGNIYEVDIPEDSELLDFDKPLSEQSSKVIKALRSLNDSYINEVLDSEPRSMDGGEYWSFMGDTYDTKREALEDHSIENVIRGQRGRIGDSPKSISHALNDVGIKGLRYLDGISRSLGRGNHNYVIWDESAVTVKAVNDQPRFSKGREDVPMFSMGRDPETEEALDRLGLNPKEQQNLLQKISAFIKELWENKFNGDWRVYQRAYEGLFDGLIGIKRAEDEVGVTDYAESGYVGARLATGVADVMSAVLNYGAPEWRGGVIQFREGTEGLMSILSDLGTDLDAWLAWMAAHRAEQLMDQGRENNLTEEDIRALKRQAQGKEQLFKDVKARYNALNTAMLDLAEEAGLIKPNSRSQWESEWYVPFYRQSEVDGNEAALLGPRTKRGLSHQSAGIKALKGGEMATNDLLENILQNWIKLTDSSMKNMALLKAVDNLKDSRFLTNESMRFERAAIPKSQVNKLIKDDREYREQVAAMLGLGRNESENKVIDELAKLDSESYETMWALTAPSEPDIIRVSRNGKHEYYRVNDDSVLRAFTHINTVGSSDPITKSARYFKRLLTTGVTASPDFILRNFIRDAVHAWAINPDGFKFALDSGSGMKGAWKEDSHYRELMFSGASFQGGYVHGTDPDRSAQIVRRALEAKGLSQPEIERYESSLLNSGAKLTAAMEQAWQKYRNVGDKVENANRLATFKKAVESGKPMAQAVFEAKDLMDYSLRGNFQALIWFTDVIPFLNARMQGLSKLGRAAKENPQQLKSAGMKIAAFSAALALLNMDDERYEEIPDWDKDANWHFFIGDEHFRIPKPFEIGVIFGTMPERLVHTMLGNQDNEKLAWSIKHNLLHTFNFNPIPQFILPVSEVVANRSFFFDTPIEGMADEGKMTEARYNERTSSTAVELGRVAKWAGVSPKQLEHLWAGYTGTLGTYALMLSDVFVNHFTDREKPAWGLEDYPVIKSFYRGSGPAKSTQYATDFYDRLSEVDEIARTIKAYRKEGRTEDARELQRSNRDKLKYRGALGRARKQMGDLNKQIERISRSKSYTREVKRLRIQKLQKRKNELAKRIAELTDD